LHRVQHHLLGIGRDSTAGKGFAQLHLVVLHIMVGFGNSKIQPTDLAEDASDVAGASPEIKMMAAEFRTLAGGTSTE
jgi:hypothetical protein